MRRGLLLAAAAALLPACASRLSVGPRKEGFVVESAAIAPITVSQRAAEAAAVADADRSALEGLLELWISSEAVAKNRAELETRVLSKAGDFIPRYKIVSSQVSQRLLDEKLLVLVSSEKLAKELDAMGLVKPDGVEGKPRVMLALDENGPGAGPEVGTASDALRRALMERGYVVYDFSDLRNPEHRRAGGLDEAAAEAKKLGAGVLATGEARAAAADDARLADYHPFKARVSVKLWAMPAREPIDEFAQEAEAVDPSGPGAAIKALSDAGELAGGRALSALAARYRERTEMSVLFSGIGGVERAKRLLAALRAQPPVVAAVLDGLGASDMRVRVFVERATADELAAALLRLPGYHFNVRSVESDFHSIELEEGS